MVYNQIHIPLGKELKGNTLCKIHTEHRVSLFDGTFLAAPHGVTEIDASTLDSLNPGIKIVRLAKFHSSVSIFSTKSGTRKCQAAFPYGRRPYGLQREYSGSVGKPERAFPLS